MEIERLSDNKLRRDIWRFSLSAPRFGRTEQVNVFVEYYGRETRATIRHKFKSDPLHRFDNNDRRAYNSGIEAAAVPLPADVVDEVKRRVSIVVHAADTDRQRLV